MDYKRIGIGLLAGLACTLMIAAAGNSGPGGLPLLILAPFPIYAAAFAWGTNTAIVSSLAAIFFTGLALSPVGAVVTGLAFTLPASLIGHQANLGQPDQDGNMEWYPLSILFFNLSLVLSVGFAALLVYNGYEEIKQQALPLVSQAIDEVVKNNEIFQQVSPAELDAMKDTTFDWMPFWVSGLWMIIHVINATLAAFICRASGMMPRPKDDIPADIRLPIAALGILIASVIVTWVSEGAAQYYAGPFLGIFLTAFSLVGLAMLHFRARTNPFGFILLIVSYLMIFFIYIPLFVFSGGGIARTLRQTRNTPPAAGNNT